MSVYYNEYDPYPAQWLRNLTDAGHIPYGTVDERSISDVRANDLVGITQAHFFSGLGGWPYALRLAGWPDDRPVWTGSCPCQPFSGAGKRGGFEDPRHLWPIWFRLIRECRPPVVFGEQVASPDGMHWLDLVSADLEQEGYAVGAADLCAAGVGAPHIRQRLYFVAHTERHEWRQVGSDAHGRRGRGDQEGMEQRSPNGGVRDVAFTDARRRWTRGLYGDGRPMGGWRTSPVLPPATSDPSPACQADPGPVNGFWSDAQWIYCRDGRYRAAKPGTFPLAYGSASSVGRLRAYGNAIVPQVAAAFVQAYMIGLD